MSFDVTRSLHGPNQTAATRLRMMAAACRLKEWDCRELAETADVTEPTARKFGVNDLIERRKVQTGGRPKTVYTLTDEGHNEIEREISGFFQQCYRIALDQSDGNAAGVREAVEKTFDAYFDNIDYEYAASPTDYDPEVVVKVFRSL